MNNMSDTFEKMVSENVNFEFANLSIKRKLIDYINDATIDVKKSIDDDRRNFYSSLALITLMSDVIPDNDESSEKLYFDHYDVINTANALIDTFTKCDSPFIGLPRKDVDTVVSLDTSNPILEFVSNMTVPMIVKFSFLNENCPLKHVTQAENSNKWCFDDVLFANTDSDFADSIAATFAEIGAVAGCSKEECVEAFETIYDLMRAYDNE